MSLGEIKKGIAVPVAGADSLRWHVPSA